MAGSNVDGTSAEQAAATAKGAGRSGEGRARLAGEAGAARSSEASGAERAVKRSCIDCPVAACGKHTDNHPSFCDTAGLSDAERGAMRDAYRGEELAIERAALDTAARVGREALCRLEETMAFCHSMGYRKIGIANCGALQAEAVTTAKILRIHGYEVFGVSCKFGELEGSDFFDEPCGVSPTSRACNPLVQVARLNEWGSDFNLIVGLCVGHDALFARHSDAPVSTLVAKDRTLGNNPVAALNTCCYPAHIWSRLLKENETLSAR